MNKSLFYSLLLLCAFPVAAMEQSRFARASNNQYSGLASHIGALLFGDKEGAEKKKTEPKSLVDCCKQFMGRERANGDIRSAQADKQDMEQVLKLILPLDITCHVLANVHQSVIDKYDKELRQLLNSPCHKIIKNIILKRLATIDEFAEWIHNAQVSSHVKCALIERIAELQTIELIEQVAEQGPITQEVAHIFCQLLTKTKKIDLFIQILKGALLSENARAHGNEFRFAKSIQDHMKLTMPQILLNYFEDLNLHDTVDLYITLSLMDLCSQFFSNDQFIQYINNLKLQESWNIFKIFFDVLGIEQLNRRLQNYQEEINNENVLKEAIQMLASAIAYTEVFINDSSIMEPDSQKRLEFLCEFIRLKLEEYEALSVLTEEQEEICQKIKTILHWYSQTFVPALDAKHKELFVIFKERKRLQDEEKEDLDYAQTIEESWHNFEGEQQEQWKQRGEQICQDSRYAYQLQQEQEDEAIAQALDAELNG